MNTQVEQLRLVADKLSARDREFALSLISQAHKLSEKQAYWVGRLLDKATAPIQATAEIQVDGIVRLFGKVADRLKWPKIRLILDGAPIVLSVAGSRARYPGSINVVLKSTDPNAGREADTFCGRVHTSGVYEAHERAAHVQTQVIALLKRFALDPSKVAAEYGHLTGHCCFCTQGLKDERSTAVGYGPVCAANYELDWGNSIRTENGRYIADLQALAAAPEAGPAANAVNA